MTNYWPLSLLTGFLRYSEKAMSSRLSQHLQFYSILVTEQYGFRKGISTEGAAFRLTDTVFNSVYQKMHVGGILCDTPKAFGCVNLEILLAKLHLYGIRGVYENWFRSYLAKRRQSFK
jgi:hypothetical protein